MQYLLECPDGTMTDLSALMAQMANLSGAKVHRLSGAKGHRLCTGAHFCMFTQGCRCKRTRAGDHSTARCSVQTSCKRRAAAAVLSRAPVHASQACIHQRSAKTSRQHALHWSRAVRTNHFAVSFHRREVISHAHRRFGLTKAVHRHGCPVSRMACSLMTSCSTTATCCKSRAQDCLQTRELQSGGSRSRRSAT